MSSNGEECDNLCELIRSLFLYIEKERKSQKDQSELVDKLVQCCERLPSNRLRHAFDLPTSKSEKMQLPYPKLDIVFDEFERKLLNSILQFDMLASYLKVICQLIITSRHGRKSFKQRLKLPDRDYFELPNAGDTLSSVLISLFTNPDIIVKTLSGSDLNNTNVCNFIGL